MSSQGIKIERTCPNVHSGYHLPSEPVWNERVLASVITCLDCGEQWIVRTEEKP